MNLRRGKTSEPLDITQPGGNRSELLTFGEVFSVVFLYFLASTVARVMCSTTRPASVCRMLPFTPCESEGRKSLVLVRKPDARSRRLKRPFSTSPSILGLKSRAKEHT